MNRIQRPGAGAVGLALLIAASTACGGGDSGESGPDLNAAPSNVRWQSFQGVALPQSDQGPRSGADGAATGFDHSPPGAAVAAIVHTVRLSIAPDGQWSQVVNREVVPGPARDEWAINRVQLSITGPAAAEYAPRVLGYRVTDYTDERSTVDVYTEYSDSSRAVTHTTVEWFDEDWRLRLPDPGSTVRPVDAVDQVPAEIVQLEAPK
ncbi:hypothetical protein [Nocardia jiangsuensis]|uniref:DUF8175 domain-containing protein n=1 Tax=Nocardia jiangsuensis TaxID=1691563 RepID=A0ABV8DSM6_9NOCA